MIAKIYFIRALCRRKMRVSWSVWIPFSEGFSFRIDYLSLGFICCSRNSDGLYQHNGCLTNYVAALGFSVSFSSVWEDQALPLRTEIIFPLCSQFFFSSLANVSRWCQTWEDASTPLSKLIFFCKQESISRLPCNSGLGHLQPCHSLWVQTILPSWCCRCHRGAWYHVLFEYCFKMGRVD